MRGKSARCRVGRGPAGCAVRLTCERALLCRANGRRPVYRPDHNGWHNRLHRNRSFWARRFQAAQRRSPSDRRSGIDDRWLGVGRSLLNFSELAFAARAGSARGSRIDTLAICSRTRESSRQQHDDPDRACKRGRVFDGIVSARAACSMTAGFTRVSDGTRRFRRLVSGKFRRSGSFRRKRPHPAEG